MFRVDTPTVFAEVIQNQGLGNGPYKQLVSHSVCPDLASLEADDAVTAADVRAVPSPTAIGFGGEMPKSFLKGHCSLDECFDWGQISTCNVPLSVV